MVCLNPAAAKNERLVCDRRPAAFSQLYKKNAQTSNRRRRGGAAARANLEDPEGFRPLFFSLLQRTPRTGRSGYLTPTSR